MKILIFFGLIAVTSCGDYGFDGTGVHLPGLYPPEEVYGGGYHGAIGGYGGGYSDYGPQLGPAVDVKYDNPGHPFGNGAHNELHDATVEGYGHGYFERPVPHHFDGWKPIIKKPVIPLPPVVKKIVVQPYTTGHLPVYEPIVHAAPILKSPGLLAPAHNYIEPHVYKHVGNLYKAKTFSVTPSLSYGFSYKLVPTFAYGPAVVNDHGLPDHGHEHGYH